MVLDNQNLTITSKDVIEVLTHFKKGRWSDLQTLVSCNKLQPLAEKKLYGEIWDSATLERKAQCIQELCEEVIKGLKKEEEGLELWKEYTFLNEFYCKHNKKDNIKQVLAGAGEENRYGIGEGSYEEIRKRAFTRVAIEWNKQLRELINEKASNTVANAGSLNNGSEKPLLPEKDAMQEVANVKAQLTETFGSYQTNADFTTFKKAVLQQVEDFAGEMLKLSHRTQLSATLPINQKGNENTRLLIAGCGHIVTKLKHTWDLCVSENISLTFIDNTKDENGPQGKPDIPKESTFINLNDPVQLDKFNKDKGRFNICLILTTPKTHIETAKKYEDRVDNFIFCKPVDSDLQKFKNLMDDPSPSSLRSKSYVYAHYRNKAVTTRLKKNFSEYRKMYGKLKRIEVCITEFVLDAERPCLKEGLILDLASQAFAALTEILGNIPGWEINSGKYEPAGMAFTVERCYTAQQKDANIPNETFAVIVGTAVETLVIPSPDDKNSASTQVNPILITIVVGKGIQEHDCKGLLFIFEDVFGQVTEVEANFATDWTSLDDKSDYKRSDPTHLQGGMNLPFTELIKLNCDISALIQQQDTVKSFQRFEQAEEVMRLTHLALRLRKPINTPEFENGKYKNGTAIEKLMESCGVPFTLPKHENIMKALERGITLIP